MSPRRKNSAPAPGGRHSGGSRTEPGASPPPSPGSSPAPGDEAARRRIREERAVTMAVDAGAGTGKTTELLARLVGLLLDDGVPLARVAAITFTEKAAAELSLRLRRLLEDAWNRRPEKRPLLKGLLRDLERTNVSTIHSFCGRILREFPFEAGLDPQFEVLDAVQAEVESRQRWEDWLGRALQKEAPELTTALRCGVAWTQVERIRDFLERNRILLGPPAPVPPVPDPGPVRRLLQAAEPALKRILAAGLEPEERLTKAAAQELSILSELAATESPDHPFVLMRGKVVGHVHLGNRNQWGADLAKLRAAVEAPRQALWDFQEKMGAHVLRALEGWLRGFLDDPGDRKAAPSRLTFDDLLLKTRDLLKTHPAVRERLARRFERIFVDEFQDTDPLQAEIVSLLCSAEDPAGEAPFGKGRLFVVGDPKQSIYRFRRADLGQYLEVRERVRRSPGGEVPRLFVNFRTLPGVIEWVNGRFESLFSGQDFDFVPLVAARLAPPPGALPPVTGLRLPAPVEGGEVNAKAIEARAVAAQVKRLLTEAPPVLDPHLREWRPLRPGDVAVLFRNLSGYEEEYEEAFRRLDVPFTVTGGKKFYRRPEVAALSSLLTCLSAPAEEALAVAVLRSILFGFSDAELFRLRAGGRRFRFLEPFEPKDALENRLKDAFELLGRLRRDTAGLGLPEALREIFRATDLLLVTGALPHGAQRVANLMKVRDLAASLEDSENATLRGFASWLRERQESEADEEQAPGTEEGDGAVRWMTVHQAKGLEFPVVVVAGFEAHGEASLLVRRGTGSTELSLNQGELATPGFEELKKEEKEERAREDQRLLYVACTRARDALVIPFPVGMKDSHLLSGLCEGWEEASAEAPVSWVDPSGARVRFEIPPPFPEDSPDRASHGIVLEGADPASPEIRRAGEELDASRAEWNRRVQTLRGGELTARAHEAWDPGIQVEQGHRAEGDGTGMRFGSLVHRLMELALSGDGKKLAAGAAVWGSELSLGPRLLREALEVVTRAGGHDLIRRARASGRVFCEAQAAQLLSGGVVREGVLDLAFVEEGAWVVVDYKTDREPRRFLEKYQAQLKAYADLLTASTGMPVKEALLFYLRSGDVVPVPLEPDSASRPR